MCIRFDNKGGNALGTLGSIGLGIDQDDICDWTVGDIDFGAVQHVVVAIAYRSGRHRPKCIRPGARFGQSKRPDQRAVAQARNVVINLVLRPVAQKVIQTQIVMRPV